MNGINPTVSFAALTAGFSHTCGLTTDARAFCWGYGPLGSAETRGSPVPVPVDVSGINPTVSFKSVEGGVFRTCGVATDGRAFCWGNDLPGGSSQVAVLVDVSGISPPVSFAALAAGGDHTCGLATDGRAFCWGENSTGQLGNGEGATGTCDFKTPCAQYPVPVDVSGINPPVSFIALSAGGYHTCGLATDGRAFCWGSDQYGQLGNGGGSANSQSPVQIGRAHV